MLPFHTPLTVFSEKETLSFTKRKAVSEQVVCKVNLEESSFTRKREADAKTSATGKFFLRSHSEATRHTRLRYLDSGDIGKHQPERSATCLTEHHRNTALWCMESISLFTLPHTATRIPLCWLDWDSPGQRQGSENVTQSKVHCVCDISTECTTSLYATSRLGAFRSARFESFRRANDTFNVLIRGPE